MQIVAAPSILVNPVPEANLAYGFGSSWVLDRTVSRVHYGDLANTAFVNVSGTNGFTSTCEAALIASAFPVLPGRKPDRAAFAVQVLTHAVLRAIVAAHVRGEPVLVRYLRHPSYYSSVGKEYGCKQGLESSYSMAMAVVASFIREGWVTDVSYQHTYSLLRPNPGAIPADLVGQHVSIPSSVLLRVQADVGGTVTQVPVGTKHLTEASSRYRDTLEINAATAKHDYSVVVGKVLFSLGKTVAQYHSVYNSPDLKQGGRLYCPAQNLPSKDHYVRQALMIDGQPTVELDYGNLHIRMLYARKGVALVGDCYDVDLAIPGWDVPAEHVRSLVKTTTLSLPNCGSPSATYAENYRTAANTCRSQYTEWLSKHGAISMKKERAAGLDAHPYRLPSGYTSQVILDAILAKHPAIADTFFTGQGIYLQATDSKIACQVMLSMARLGKACIGVHDSFIVKEEDKDLLTSAMTAAYVRFVGTAPIIDAKKKVEGTFDYLIEAGGIAPIHVMQHADTMTAIVDHVLTDY